MSENLSNIVIKSNEEKGYTEIFVDGHKFFMKFLRYARMGSMAAARASF